MAKIARQRTPNRAESPYMKNKTPELAEVKKNGFYMSIFKKLGIKYPLTSTTAERLDTKYNSMFAQFDEGKKPDKLSFSQKFYSILEAMFLQEKLQDLKMSRVEGKIFNDLRTLSKIFDLVESEKSTGSSWKYGAWGKDTVSEFE